MMKTKSLLVVMTMIIAVSNVAFAAEGHSAPDRVLGGHSFIPSIAVPDPFVNTKFGTSTGVGLGFMDILQDVGHYTAGTHNLAVLGESFDLQLGLFDLLALRAKLSGQVMSGVNADGLLNTGANVGYDYELGATVRVLRLDRFQLAVNASLVQNNGININPGPVINSLLEGGSSTSGLISKSNTTGFLAGTQLALALHESFGIWINGQYQHEMDGDVTTKTLILGSGLSFDMDPLIGFPLGFGAHYKLEYSLEDHIDPWHYFGGGVYITGRQNVVLGLEGQASMFSISSDDTKIVDLFGFEGAVKLYYYW
jgi:hypothetical protein